MLDMLSEYKKVLNYIVDNELNEGNIKDTHKEEIANMIRFTCSVFDKQTIELLINKVLKINEYALYFNIDLKKI